VEGTRITHWGLDNQSATKMSPELGLDYSGEGPKCPVFGVAKAIDGQPVLDPLLQWPVPEGWTSTDAATVPLAYSQAYLAIGRYMYRQMRSRRDNVLVTEPLHPEGQASVRVAMSMNQCALVYVIAKDATEEGTIRALFRDAVGAHKLRCIRSGRRSIANTFRTKELFGTKIDVIITIKPENVRTDILAVLERHGNILCLGGADSAVRKSFGKICPQRHCW